MIQAQELSNYRKISQGYKFDKVEESVELAKTDMREHIGDRLFFDALKNIDTPAYDSLLNGGEFDVDGITYIHDGLKAMYADYTYVRYLQVINVSHGPNGLVVKENNDSNVVALSTIKELSRQAQTDADRRWELIKIYLDLNLETFPVWANNKNTNTDDVSLGQNRFNFLSSGKNRNI